MQKKASRQRHAPKMTAGRERHAKQRKQAEAVRGELEEACRTKESTQRHEMQR